MGKIIKSIMGGGKPDNSALLAEQKEQREKLAEREAKAEAGIEARKKVSGAGAGARSLLASSRGAGVAPGLAATLGST